MELCPPTNEAARLSSLLSLHILDTPPEPAFDEIARLTSYVCGTPMAFIGFMDAHRLWFKSRIGWDVPEVRREMSFCAHTILQSDVLIVSDTLSDDRLATCPLATRGGIRFYAGAPLISSQGYALGTLCAMDSIPRGLTSGQTEVLRRLARQVVHLVELKHGRPSQADGSIAPQPACQQQTAVAPATILVVEDEATLRRLICICLEKRNHKVFPAKDGAEALAIFRQNSQKVQVVVSDLMMPHMNGLELKEHILTLKAGVKFLFMSGYAEQIVQQHRGSLAGCVFLEKPFLPRELADRVDRLLAGDAAA